MYYHHNIVNLVNQKKMFNDILKAHEELEQLNNDIIAVQKKHIEELRAHIEELHAIIKTHLLKDIKDEPSPTSFNL